MWDPNERKIYIEHGDPCRCRVIDGAIWIASPCRSIGHLVTKRCIAQLAHGIRRAKGKEA